MSFWVNVDSAHPRKIHTSTCQYAQVRPQKTQGGWYGPFNSYQDAYNNAKQGLRSRQPENCSNCQPQTKRVFNPDGIGTPASGQEQITASNTSKRSLDSAYWAGLVPGYSGIHNNGLGDDGNQTHSNKDLLFCVNVDKPTSKTTRHVFSCEYVNRNGKLKETGYWCYDRTEQESLRDMQESHLPYHDCPCVSKERGY